MGEEPRMIPVSNRRYVVDHGVVTTTGVPHDPTVIEAFPTQALKSAIARDQSEAFPKRCRLSRLCLVNILSKLVIKIMIIYLDLTPIFYQMYLSQISVRSTWKFVSGIH